MQLLHQLELGFTKWKWSSYVQVTLGKMADFGFFNSSYGASQYGNGRHRYKLRLVKWLTLENEKKTVVSQDWRHKKEKPVKILHS